jgi:hypothetical protein
VNPLETFLRSCAAALEREAEGTRRTPQEAAGREAASIINALNEQNLAAVEDSVLRLLKQFYAELAIAADGKDWGNAYWTTVDLVVSGYRTRLLDLHVQELNA